MVAQVPKSARKQFVAGASYADEVYLRFSNSCGSSENLRASALPRDLTRERSNLRR